MFLRTTFTEYQLSSSPLLSLIKVRKLLLKMRDLGSIVNHDVGLIGMHFEIVLVISLSRIKGLQRRHLGHDRPGKSFSLVELRDIGLGNALLLVVAVEDTERYCVPSSGPWRLSSVGSSATEKKTRSNSP